MSLLILTLALCAEPSSVAASTPASTESTSQPTEPDIFSILEEQEQEFVNTGFIRVKAKESAYGVWVIDRETILATPTTNIADLLRLVPGVVVRDVSPGFVETFLRYQGATVTNQMLVLIDGRTAQSDMWPFADKSGIEVKDIERIEVTLGPSSTLYGSSALTGVVNIIMRKPESGKTEASAELRSGIAMNGTGQSLPAGAFYGSLNHGWKAGGLRLSVFGDYFPSFDTYEASPTDIGVLPARRLGGSAMVEQDVNGWLLRVSGNALVHSFVYPTFNTNPPILLQDYSLAFSAEKRALFFDGDNFMVSGWARFYSMKMALYDKPLAQVDINANLVSGEVRAQYVTPRFLFGNQLVAGLQVKAYGYLGNAILPEGKIGQVYSLFLEDNWRPITQILLTLGVRLETNEVPAALAPFRRFSVSPHAAFVYLPTPNHSLRLEYATSFRTPTIFEAFERSYNADGVPIVLGDPKLPLEFFSQLCFTYQGEIAWFKPRVDLGATRVESVIVASDVPDDALPLTIQDTVFDASSPRIPAVYQQLPLQAWLPFADLKLEADFAHTKVWASYAFSPISPSHTAGLGATTHFWRFQLSSQLYFLDEDKALLSDRAIGVARIVWNAALRFAIDPEERWMVSLEGTNLVDARFGITRPTSELNIVDTDYARAERLGQRMFLSVRYNMR